MPIRETGTSGGGQALIANATSFAADLAAGATVATLSQPFGAGTAHAALSMPAQLALSGAAIVRGTGAAAAGQSYAAKIRATSADGSREVAETLSFTATGAAPPAGSTQWMASATRIVQPAGLAAAGTNTYQFVQQYLGQADWAGSAPVGLLNNAYLAGNGRMVANTNAIIIEKAGYLVGASVNPANGAVSGGTFHAVTFGGAPGGTIPAAGALASFLMHDPAGFTVPAGADVWFQIAYSVAGSTEKVPSMHGTLFPFAPLGDRFTQGSSSQAGNVGTPFTGGGTVPGNGSLCLAGFFTKGCPDTGRVVLSIHDSIGVSRDAPIWGYDARGNMAHIHQMLDATGGGGRRAYWSIGQSGLSTVGANPVANPTDGMLRWAKAVADALGNVPFRTISCALGQNDIVNGYAGTKAAFDAMADWCAANFAHTRWVQWEPGIKTTQAANSKWTDEANQSPDAGYGAGGVGEQLAAYYAGGAGGRVTSLIAHYAPLRAASDAYRWKADGLFATTVAVAHSSGAAVQLAHNAGIGTHLVFEPGDATGYDPVAAITYQPRTITGSGPFTHNFQSVGGFGQNILKAHAAGAVVKEALTPDGQHFSMRAHALVRDHVIATAKASAFP